MRKRLLLFPCLCVLAALVLAACGSGASEESKVEETIETVAASNDPADCKKLQTQKFTEQVLHETGDGAVKRCEEEAGGGGGFEAAAVSNVRVDGVKATATVALKGGSLDGQTVKVVLVKSGDQWKLNEIAEFTKFDEQKLLQGLARELERNSTEVSPNFAACFARVIRDGGEGELEELRLNPAAEELEGVAKRCA